MHNIYIYIYIYISIYVLYYIVVYVYITIWDAQQSVRELAEHPSHSYSRSPLQDSRLFGPSPWKILATTYEQMGS